MNERSRLRKEVLDFVKHERIEEENENFTPCEFALRKSEFPNEHKNFKTDYVDEDYFLLEFDDIVKFMED